MAEAANVRLVICPKCEKLLPELPDFSLYKCGGCGAILKAVKKESPENGSKKLPDDANVIQEDGGKICETAGQKETVDDGKILPSRDESKSSRDNFSSDVDRPEYVKFNENVSREFRHHQITSDRSSPPSCFRRQERATDFLPYHVEKGSSSSYDDMSRMELLRRLDELRDQLSRPNHDAAAKNKERIIGSSHSSAASPDCYGRRHHHRPDEMGPHYFSHHVPPYAGSRPLLPSDPYRYQMHCRPSYHSQPAYEHRFPHYYGGDMYLVRREEEEEELCSCRHCCGKNSGHRVAVSEVEGHVRRSQQQNLYGNDDGFSYRRPRKVVVARENRRVSFPIAGGAPFMTCYNCLELVKLPRKHISLGKKQQRMKCGACSSVIFLEIGNRDFVAQLAAHVDRRRTEIDEGGGSVGYWNDDFAGSQHKLDDNKKSNSGGSERHLNHHPVSPTTTTSSSSQDGRSQNNNVESPATETQLSKRVKESLSSSAEERDSLDRTVSIQKCPEEEEHHHHAAATEIDVPPNEFPNGGGEYASHDPVEVSKPKFGKSFLNSLMKKSFIKRFSHEAEMEESRVSVNGHAIPDRAVKKAEKLAGPIQPGEYWYDKKAGFWGVMGHHCLGIIMPDIEEFDHPMPEKCSGGNTGVFVNGRELHRKDLDLLAGRGLPTTRNRSYLVEINGEVVDEQTGEALEGLGKLAPTVERSKHGFGMKVPKSIIAQSEETDEIKCTTRT